jgi:hypothetical protein
MECARALGRMAVQSNSSPASEAELIFRRCLTRAPSEDERSRLEHFYEAQLDRFKRGELKASEVLGKAESSRPNEEAAWTTLARVLLNLDEMITKG